MIIGLFTGSRAEYGLFFSLLKILDKDKFFDYKLLVTGSHLDENFGRTIDEINNDGFKISEIFELNEKVSIKIRTPNLIGQLILKISQWLDKNDIDLLMIYGDRFETFAAAIAASQMNIPIAHIEGGDITNGGALDDSVRHAISKLSHLHFTTNFNSTNCLLRMGEESWRIFTVGLPSNDQILNKNFARINEIKEKLDIDLSRPIVIFTQHSITTEIDKVEFQINESIKALQRLSKENFQIIITYPNNDSGGLKIIKIYDKLRKSNNSNIIFYPSLGRYFYHGLLSLAKNNFKIICVGNSSSGIKETPFFNCPTVNIGSRQNGRLSAKNIINVGYNEDDIFKAIKKCAFNKNFMIKCNEIINPYDFGKVGKNIVAILKKIPSKKKLLNKIMKI